MGWAIFFLVLEVTLFIFCSAMEQDEKYSGVVVLVLWSVGLVCMIAGSITLYFSGTGEIARSGVLWHDPIYKVVGSVYPDGLDGKQITILEDGAKNISAVWLVIPEGSQFIRIAEDCKAVKVNCETQKDTKPEKTASDPAKKPKDGK